MKAENSQQKQRFRALFDQQGSTWVLQARRMDGRVGPITILPDQMNTLNPLMILILVPIFEAFVYPALRRVCKITPLRKMAAGLHWAYPATKSFIIPTIQVASWRHSPSSWRAYFSCG